MKKFSKKFNIQIECEDKLENSHISEIGPDGLNFLKEGIKVNREGLQKGVGDKTVYFQLKSDDIEFSGKVLGRGTSALVEEGYFKPRNMKVAIKVIY